MKHIRPLLMLALTLSPVLFSQDASAARLPPHKPGEICVTERLWCWNRPAGKPGQSCTCRTPYGKLRGKLAK